MYVRTFCIDESLSLELGHIVWELQNTNFVCLHQKIVREQWNVLPPFLKAFCHIHSKFTTHPLKPQTVNLLQPSVHKRIFAMVQFKRLDVYYYVTRINNMNLWTIYSSSISFHLNSSVKFPSFRVQIPSRAWIFFLLLPSFMEISFFMKFEVLFV